MGIVNVNENLKTDSQDKRVTSLAGQWSPIFWAYFAIFLTLKTKFRMIEGFEV